VFLFNLCKDETNKDLVYYIIFKRLAFAKKVQHKRSVFSLAREGEGLNFLKFFGFLSTVEQFAVSRT
jgi:hypothetical protein